MELSIHKDYDALSQHAAGQVIELVKNKPDAVLCLAAGDTPKLTYQYVARRASANKVDFSRCTFIGLDEWVGIPPENEGSCRYFLETNLFKPLNISANQIHLFNALAADPQEECIKMNHAVASKGGIDLMLVGVGMNGHIGFNEPGVSFDNYAHVINLDDTTQSVGQKYFREAMILKQGITLGLRHLMEARKVILVANATKKAAVIKKALEGAVTADMPASIITTHPNSEVIIDEEAASLLTSVKH